MTTWYPINTQSTKTGLDMLTHKRSTPIEADIEIKQDGTSKRATVKAKMQNGDLIFKSPGTNEERSIPLDSLLQAFKANGDA